MTLTKPVMVDSKGPLTLTTSFMCLFGNSIYLNQTHTMCYRTRISIGPRVVPVASWRLLFALPYYGSVQHFSDSNFQKKQRNTWRIYYRDSLLFDWFANVRSDGISDAFTIKKFLTMRQHMVHCLSIILFTWRYFLPASICLYCAWKCKDS
jgi:hypothetical protein